MLNIHTISIITNLHCNLNCAGCNHFSPLADAHFTSREKFRYNYFSDVPSRNDSRCSLLSECDGECLSRMEYAQLNENGDLFFCCIPANIS